MKNNAGNFRIAIEDRLLHLRRKLQNSFGYYTKLGEAIT